MLEGGYEIYMVADASGGTSVEAHKYAMERMTQAGIVPVTWQQVLLEWQRDWARKATYDAVMDIVREHSGAYGMGVDYAYTMVHKAPERVKHGQRRPEPAPVAARRPVSCEVSHETLYALSLGAGLLVGLIYSLLDVRSPAPPLVALVGLLGILVGEQIIPVGKQLLVGTDFVGACDKTHAVKHVFGQLPGRQQAAQQAQPAQEKQA